MTKPAGPRGIAIGPLHPTDLASVVRLDSRLTGRDKTVYWKRIFREFVARGRSASRVGLAARDSQRLAGYLVGEVRAFEFGSAPCGWIFAVGVAPNQAHHGIGSALVAEAARRFARRGVVATRTMVHRDDVSMQAFFRSNGFVGGTFTQLELAASPAQSARGPALTINRHVKEGRPWPRRR